MGFGGHAKSSGVIVAVRMLWTVQKLDVLVQSLDGGISSFASSVTSSQKSSDLVGVLPCLVAGLVEQKLDVVAEVPGRRALASHQPSRSFQAFAGCGCGAEVRPLVL